MPSDSSGRSTRRDFLQRSALVATGTTAIAVAATQLPATTSRPTLRIVVVGNPGDELLSAAVGHPGCRTVATYRTSSEVSERIARMAERRKHEPAAAVEDLGRFLAGPRCDAVLLAARGKSVASAAELALARGKSVLLTAPFGVDAADAERLGRFAAGRPGHAFLPHRSYVGIRQAIEYLRAGHLGDSLTAFVVFSEPVHAKRGRGHDRVLALGRLLDLAIWGLGNGNIDDVRALGTRGKRTLRLTGGAARIGNGELVLELCPPSSPARRGIRTGVAFVGSRGRLIFRNDDSAVAFRSDGEIARVFKGSGDPLAAFARSAAPVAAISECWRSSALWHLLVASLRNAVPAPSSDGTAVPLAIVGSSIRSETRLA